MDSWARAERGRMAERLALAHVRALGWWVLGQNLRVGRDELDLVARDGDVVVIVEVRFRGATAWQRALASVGAAKRRRLARAARRLWRARLRHDPTVRAVRFDVVAVDASEATPVIRHVRAAFRADP